MTKDAIAVLNEDHEKVDKLFKRFERIKDEAEPRQKSHVVLQACAELTVHAQLEEKYFYPMLRRVFDEEDLLDEAEVEHQSIKELVSQIERMSPSDPLYDAKVVVLSEYVKHHVREEQNEIFPKVRASGMDLAELGEELEIRKAQIKKDLGVEDAAAEKAVLDAVADALDDMEPGETPTEAIEAQADVEEQIEEQAQADMQAEIQRQARSSSGSSRRPKKDTPRPGTQARPHAPRNRGRSR
jgi:hemerythrin superfamily protein